jgi:hypothetical protein
VWNRKFCIVNPQRPKESSARGSRIMLLLTRSSITSSPIIDSAVCVLTLSARLNFFRSKVCKCLSARADIDVITSAERLNLEGNLERQLPIVMSAPMVV